MKPRSPEHRRKLSEALRGHAVSSETRAKISAANRSRPLSADHRQKLSLTGRGRKHTAAARAKISAAARDRVLTSDQVDRLRALAAAQRGKELSAETRDRMSASHRGQTPSPATRAKLRAAKRGWHFFSKRLGVCAICAKSPQRGLVRDHDHVTGRLRGFICFTCNAALGLLGDDLLSVRRAVAYLEVAAANDAKEA